MTDRSATWLTFFAAVTFVVTPMKSSGSQMLPSKIAFLQDCTSGVDESTRRNMREVAASISRFLTGSRVEFGCISDTVQTVYNGTVGEDDPLPFELLRLQYNGNSIDAKALAEFLRQQFPGYRAEKTAEIAILLVSSGTDIKGTFKDEIFEQKKIIVVQFGPDESITLKNLATRDDLTLLIKDAMDIQKVIGLESKLAKEATLVCDTTDYSLDAMPRTKLYQECQCRSCDNICNFSKGRGNQSDTCMKKCFDHPLLNPKDVVRKQDKKDNGGRSLTVLIVSIAAVMVIFIAIVIWMFCFWQSNRPKVNETVAQQESDVQQPASSGSDSLLEAPRNVNMANDFVEEDGQDAGLVANGSDAIATGGNDDDSDVVDHVAIQVDQDDDHDAALEPLIGSPQQFGKHIAVASLDFKDLREGAVSYHG